MGSFEKYQRQVLEQTQHVFHETPVSEATVRAFLDTPRHLFVRRYRQFGAREWHRVTEANLEEHLAALYANGTLTLFGDDDDNPVATISHPGLVLRMLDMLQLERGHSVFELGAGSGWNAALLGQLVGTQGRVHSLEIVPEVAAAATESIRDFGLSNVQIVEADGSGGYAAGAPYDRAVFTAGAYDLARSFYEQVTEGGLLLLVLKNEGGWDNLFVLRKEADHFASLESLPCGFVPMTGRYQMGTLDPGSLDALPQWAELKRQEVSRTPFWWGGKGKTSFLLRTLAVRSFFSITEPTFRCFKAENPSGRAREDRFFGLWDEENESLVVARDDQLISYGSEVARDRLLERIHQWLGLGMPGAAAFDLTLYPMTVPVEPRENQWVVRREESQFLWSLKTSAERELPA